MNSGLQAAAEAVVDALLWLEEDALLMRRVPTYDPKAHPELGPEAEVKTLQGYYLPHRRLPPTGCSHTRAGEHDGHDLERGPCNGKYLKRAERCSPELNTC